MSLCKVLARFSALHRGFGVIRVNFWRPARLRAYMTTIYLTGFSTVYLFFSFDEFQLSVSFHKFITFVA